MSFPTQHILVVANETATGEELHRTVRALAGDPAARVHVVAPALDAAQARLETCLQQLAGLGLAVDGDVGDEDPLQAITDALVTFPATELVIATHPESRSNWLARDLVDRALAQFGLPTVHVVVDVAIHSRRLEAVAA